MHTTNPSEFADILDAAADIIAAAPQHPGQFHPGVWRIGGENTPERVIGVVAANALAKVCQQRQFELEKVLKSYAETSKNISIKPKGGPDVMAMNHLRDAATELRRIARGDSPRQSYG